jgi:hypothetical protein
MLFLAGSTFVAIGVVLGGLLIMVNVTGEKARRLVGSLRT